MMNFGSIGSSAGISPVICRPLQNSAWLMADWLVSGEVLGVKRSEIGYFR
jgi:hypothetical protein